jgi:hypothetical protein
MERCEAHCNGLDRYRSRRRGNGCARLFDDRFIWLVLMVRVNHIPSVNANFKGVK